MKSKILFDNGTLVIPEKDHLPMTINGQPAKKTGINLHGKLDQRVNFWAYDAYCLVFMPKGTRGIRKYLPRISGCISSDEVLFLKKDLPKNELVKAKFGDPTEGSFSRISDQLCQKVGGGCLRFVVCQVEAEIPIYLLFKIDHRAKYEPYFIRRMRFA